MVEAPKEEEELKLSLPVIGPVVARGGIVFIFLGILGVGWVTWEIMKEHIATEARYRQEQRIEHEELRQYMEYNSCLNRLAIYVARTSRDEQIDWWNMPQDLVQCSPRFLSEKAKK